MAPRYPMDSITEAEHCELMTKCQNLTFKAAIGSVVPPRAEGTFHCYPIPHDYAVVTVDEIMDGFEGLELDNPTGEEDIILLENALRSTCLWRKEYIKLPNWTPQQTQPPPARQGTLPPPPPPPPARQGTPPPLAC